MTKTVTLGGIEIEIKPGEHYAGLILDAAGKPDYHLILLPGTGDDLTWDAAREWATAAGGDLPTRREQSLLFANAKDKFQLVWYWSSEQHMTDGSYAWFQNFYYGSQYNLHKSYEGRARAVRRLKA